MSRMVICLTLAVLFACALIGSNELRYLRSIDAIALIGVAPLQTVSGADMAPHRAEITQTLQRLRFTIAALLLLGLLALYVYLRQTGALERSGVREVDGLQREEDGRVREEDGLQRERVQLDLQVHERAERLGALATHLLLMREEERGHLARELHDEMGAILTAAKLDIARLKLKLGGAPPDTLKRLQHLNDTLNNGIALSRRIIEDLRPSSLSHLGLVASLEILASEFAERSGLAVATDFEAVELPGSTQLTVYRLVQESLTNIGKYAEASQVAIGLRIIGNDVSVTVTDNGKGFVRTHIKPTSHGLAGMQHRVEAAGGRLTVASGSGLGTRISAHLPLST